MTAQWDDDVHHALHVALTGEAHGYYADFAGGGARDEAGPLDVLAKVLTRGFLHDGTMSTFRWPAVGRPGRRRAPRRATAARLPADARPGRQPDDGRPHLRGHSLRALQAAGAALYLLAPTTPDGLHGRGVGGVDAVAVLHELRGGRARRRRASRPAGGVRRARLVRGRGARPAGPRDPRPLGARLGRGAPRAATRAMLRWYSACTALRRDLLARRRRRGFADVAVSRRRGRPLAGHGARPGRRGRHSPWSSTSPTAAQDVPLGAARPGRAAPRLGRGRHRGVGDGDPDAGRARPPSSASPERPPRRTLRGVLRRRGGGACPPGRRSRRACRRG